MRFSTSQIFLAITQKSWEKSPRQCQNSEIINNTNRCKNCRARKYQASRPNEKTYWVKKPLQKRKTVSIQPYPN